MNETQTFTPRLCNLNGFYVAIDWKWEVKFWVLKVEVNLISAGWCRRKFSILWGEIIGHFEKKVRLNVCPILNAYLDKAVWISRPNSVGFLSLAFDLKRSLQNKSGYMRRITRSNFGCCYPHKGEDQLRRTQQAIWGTRVEQCTEDDDRIFEHLWWTVTICHLCVKGLSTKH